MTKIHVRRLMWEPCMTVFVVTLNWRLQSRHFQTRRSDWVPRVVSRLRPFAGSR